MDNKWKILIGLILSILLGIGLSNTSIFIYLLFILVLLFTLGVTVLVGLFDVFSKTKRFIYPGLVFICLSTSLLSAIIIKKSKEANQEAAAELIINDLYNYKKKEGKFPDSLSQKYKAEFPDYSYSVNSTQQEFELVYTKGEWFTKYYNSENKEWRVRD